MKIRIDGQLRQINEARYQALCRIAKAKNLNTIEEAIKCSLKKGIN